MPGLLRTLLLWAYGLDVIVIGIVLAATHAGARRPLPPWAPPGYRRPPMPRALKTTLIALAVVGPVFAVFGALFLFWVFLYVALGGLSSS